jgi:3'-phosphoadenosine 5'-phosphosulfate sulfotransferase (PAPS reductase)/FAD synthetase
MRVVSWYSCGATSAVAAKLTVEKYPNAIIAYCDTGSEHEDNKRFLADCEKWIGRPIQVLRSEKYKDIWEVFDKKRYLVGVHGAQCTGELKKKVRKKFQIEDDLQIFGFDIAERERANRFNDNNIDVNTWYPLIEHGLSKQDCLQEIMKAGIELPTMYKLGYRNNNCIGCVKGQSGYWNKIRKDFPDVFSRMSKVERDLDVAINKSYAGDGKRKRVFLDELDPKAGRHSDLEISCGLFCGEY